MVIAWNGSVEGSDLQSMLSKLISVSGDAIDRDVNESYRYPSWGTVSKQGKVLSNVRGQLMKMANLDTGFKAQNADKQFITCRRTYAGMTIDFDANDLTNKGRVVSGQFSGDFTKTEVDIVKAVEGKIPGETVEAVISTQPMYVYDGFPNNETELTQMDPKVRQAEAKEGDYIPHRFWNPVFNLTASKDVGVMNITSPGLSNPVANQELDNINLPLIGWGVHTSFWLDMHTTSSLRVKRREGLELNTSGGSPYSPFSTPAFSQDDRALSVFREYCRTQPHSFPANFNSLGGLLKDILGTVGNILGNLGIPVVSDIAKVATPLLTDLLGNLSV